MKDEKDKAADEKTEAEAPRGGERLAEARREQEISVLEVAKELHLDESKVRALERNEFDVLGAPVFAKGHLRKYAQLVGVDVDDVFADYYQMTRSEGIPPVVPVSRARPRAELSPGPWIAVVVVIIVVVATYWWFVVEQASPVAPAPRETTPQDSEPAVRSAAIEEQPAVTNAVTAEPPVAEAETRTVAPEPEPETAQAGDTRISLTFTGDCWTEISDATGRRLFFEMGRDGRAIELSGRAPFAVLFGNAENVSVRVDGSEYPVSPSNPGSRTARLTILAP